MNLFVCEQIQLILEFEKYFKLNIKSIKLCSFYLNGIRVNPEIYVYKTELISD